MKKIGIVIPYYGEFPNYFNLFLKSCEKNPTIDWLIFTDISEVYDFPDNVNRIEMSFEQLKEIFQSKFNFPIVLDTPYKLCDYKVMYGYLFSEYLLEYDYWGYGDIDMIFGNIRRFLPDEMLTQYDKIGHLGHFTIYRNADEINTLFMKPICGDLHYKKVLSSNSNFFFDEWHDKNINEIFAEQKKKIYFFNDFFDVEPNEENFRRGILNIEDNNLSKRNHVIEKHGTFASWEDGQVFQWKKQKGIWCKEEYMYIHFQKRNMKVCIDLDKSNKFLCVPNKFIEYADNIPNKYLVKSIIMEVFNLKHWNLWLRIKKYNIIVKTAPIRHKIQGRNKIV